MLSQKFSYIILLVMMLLTLTAEKYAQEKTTSTTNFSLCWQFDLEEQSILKSASDNANQIYILTDKNQIIAIDIEKGEKLWTSELIPGNGKVMDVSADRENLLVKIQNYDTKKLQKASYSTSSGILNGKIEEDFNENISNPLNAQTMSNLTALVNIDNDRKILGDSKGNVLYINNSDPIWKFKAGGQISSITSLEKELIITSFDNFVYKISTENGEKLWKKRLSGRIIDKPLLGENSMIFTTSGNNTAYILDSNNGSKIGEIILTGNNFFTGTVTKTEKYYIFKTSRGLAAFTQRQCAK